MPGIAFNETQIISDALVLLGYSPIESIDAGGQAAAAIHNIYAGIMAADLSSPNWRFATKVEVLSQIAGVNPKFKYFNAAYQIPPDCLAIWEIWPSIPYEVFGEQIWTYSSTTPPSSSTLQLQIQYRHVAPPSMLPPAYIMYFTYLLACTVAPGLTDDPKVIQLLQADMAKWRSQAMVVNTQGRPNQGLTNSPWVNSRVAGSYFGTSWAGSA
jgi:hypothetical protein